MSENEILRLGQQDLKQVIKNSDKSLIFTFPENKNNNLPDFLGRKRMHFALKTQRIIKPSEIHDLAENLKICKSKFTVKRVIKKNAKYVRLSVENLCEHSLTKIELIKFEEELKTKLDAVLIRLRWKKIPSKELVESSIHTKIDILTLNVNGLKAKEEEVWDKLNQLQPTIVFLQETERKEMEKRLSIPGYKSCEVYQDLENKSRGLLVAVRNSVDLIVNNINNYDNMIVMEIKCKEGNFIIANVYNPCKGPNRKITIKNVADILKKYEKDTNTQGVIVAGDWNAKPEEIYSQLSRIGSKSCIDSCPSEGTRIKPTRKFTKRTIDFAIESSKGLIVQQAIRRDWNISGHCLVNITIDMEARCKPELYKTLFDRTKLSEKGVIDSLKNYQYTPPSPNDKAQTVVTRFNEEITKKLRESGVIKTQKVNHGQYQLPEKIKTLILIKRLASIKVRKRKANIEEYEAACKNVKKALSEMRNSKILKFKKRGIEALRHQNIREAWRWVNQNCGNSRKRPEETPMRDNLTGKIESSVEGKAKVWKEHFENLAKPCEKEMPFNKLIKKNDEIKNITDAPISWSEITCELKSTGKHKAAGDDLIPSELYKLVENEKRETSNLAKMILIIINLVYSEERVPEEWKNSTIVAIFKKGDKKDPNNYRGIALINTMLKILSKVLAKRLQTVVINFDLLRREQTGFMRSEECVAQAASLLEICQRRRNEGTETILLFLDLKKAYDLVPHRRLIQKLEAKGLGTKMLNMLNNMYQTTLMKVRVGDIVTETYKYKRGVRQGCPTSPMIFNLYIDDLLDNINPIKTPGILGEIRGLAFADDTIIFADNQKDLEIKIEEIKKWMSLNSMELNPNKCGIMHIKNIIGPDPMKEATFYCEEEIPVVEKYAYLGIGFNRYLDSDLMARHRCQIGALAGHKIGGTLSDTKIPITYKKMLVQNFLIPTMLYGQEIYGMSLERSTPAKKILDNSIMRIVKKHNFCRRRLYDELDIKDINTATVIGRARGYFKWKNSKGVIKWILDSKSIVKSRKRTWSQVSASWLKRTGINPYGNKEEQLNLLAKNLKDKANAKDKSRIGEFATEHKIRSGKIVREL